MIYIHQHLGLGDYFVTKGLLKYLQDVLQERFGVFCKHHNTETVSQLLSDMNVEVLPVENDGEVISKVKDHKLIRIGFCPDLINTYGWESAFYIQHNIDYSCRWTNWSCPRDYSRESELKKHLQLNKPYIFVADTCSKGKVILPIISSLTQVSLQKLSNNLLDWLGVIEEAEEVHVIDSSVFQLIKQLNLKATKFFYDIRSQSIHREPYTLPNGWEEKAI